MVDKGEFVDVDPLDDRVAVLLDRYVDGLIAEGVIGEADRHRIDLEPERFRWPAGVLCGFERRRTLLAIGGVYLMSPGVAEVKRMFVDPSLRGSGHGRRLLAVLEERARLLGATRIVLDTASVLTPAISLYRSAGYVEIERYNDNPDCSMWFGHDL